MDRRLAELGRGVGALRLKIGEALEAFATRGGVTAFGMSSLAAYALERLGRSGHWAADARSLARRLASLPTLRRALRSGELGTSMVELLARHVDPLTEASLIAEARGLTVRAMRARLADEKEPRPHAERSTVVAIVDAVDALTFERARMLVEAVGGTRSRDEVVEAMLAEALGDILTADPEMPIPNGLGAEVHPANAAWKAELTKVERAAEVAAEARMARAPVTWVAEADADTELADDNSILGQPGFARPSANDEPHALDALMRRWSTQLATRDLELGALARQMSGGHLYRRLGYASFAQYARERIGLSPSAVKARLTLAQRAAAMPTISEALGAGRVGFEAAALVARVAHRANVTTWIARAETRTVKDLREEVEAATMMARVCGSRFAVHMGPPDEDTIEALRDVERSALAALSAPDEQVLVPKPPHGPDRQMSGGRRLALSLRDDVARFWRIVEGLHRKLGRAESFVAFLCAAVERAWRGAVGGRVAYQDVYLRDRFRCASPSCSRRDVTPHHIVFRAHGGGEERSNLVSLCTVCHLELVHGGHLKVSGRAPAGVVFEARLPAQSNAKIGLSLRARRRT